MIGIQGITGDKGPQGIPEYYYQPGIEAPCRTHVCVSLGSEINIYKLTIDKCYYCIDMGEYKYALVNDMGIPLRCPKECFLPIREYNLSKLLS